MSVIPKAIIYAAALLLFIVAIQHGIYLTRGNTEMIDLSNQLIYNIDRDLVNKPEITRDIPLYGYQVRHLIYQIKDIQAVVEFDGQLFDANMLIEDINIANIDPKIEYVIELIRGSNGSIDHVFINRKQ